MLADRSARQSRLFSGDTGEHAAFHILRRYHGGTNKAFLKTTLARRSLAARCNADKLT